MSDQFRWGTLAASAVLVLVIIYLRFCGSLSLPAKPPAPTGPTGTQRELLSRSSASPSVYKGFLESDAANAGAPVPSLADMAKKLSYRVDEARHVLNPGEPPIEVAGLRIHLERTGNAVIMVIENKLDTAVGYNVVSAASSGSSRCMSASPLPYNAMTISKGGSERRTECTWRDGMSIIVTKVETLELLPLEAWYLGQVQPHSKSGSKSAWLAVIMAFRRVKSARRSCPRPSEPVWNEAPSAGGISPTSTRGTAARRISFPRLIVHLSLTASDRFPRSIRPACQQKTPFRVDRLALGPQGRLA